MEKNEISIRSNHFSIPKKYFDQAYKEVVLHLSTDKNVVFIYPKYKFENIQIFKEICALLYTFNNIFH